MPKHSARKWMLLLCAGLAITVAGAQVHLIGPDGALTAPLASALISAALAGALIVLGLMRSKAEHETATQPVDLAEPEDLETQLDACGDRVSKDHKEGPIIVDVEHFVWRFNGEYWKDELGYYRFKVRSQCPKN